MFTLTTAVLLTIVSGTFPKLVLKHKLSCHPYLFDSINLRQAEYFAMKPSIHFMKSVLIRLIGVNHTTDLLAIKYLEFGFS